MTEETLKSIGVMRGIRGMLTAVRTAADGLDDPRWCERLDRAYGALNESQPPTDVGPKWTTSEADWKVSARVDPDIPTPAVEIVSVEGAATTDAGELTSTSVFETPEVPPVVEVVEPTAGPVAAAMSLLEDAEASYERISYEDLCKAAVTLGLDHLSYSSMTTFWLCPARMIFEKAGIGPIQKPAWWNLGGNAVHAMLEQLTRAVVPAAVDMDALRQVFKLRLDTAADTLAEKTGVNRDYFRAAKSGSEGYDFWITKGPDMVASGLRFVQGLDADGWEFQAAEEKIVFQIAPGMDFWAIPDRVYRRADNILILDWKTGASMPATSQQLLAYAVSLICSGAMPRDAQYSGVFANLRKGTLIGPSKFSSDRISMVRDGIRQAAAEVLKGNVTPKPGDHCWRCDSSPVCPARG
jgi:tape measure domain-containing protein